VLDVLYLSNIFRTTSKVACACGSLVILTGAGEPVSRPKSYLSLRYSHVIRQKLDYSCGAASLATVLSYFLQTRTTESDILTIVQRRYQIPEWKGKVKEGLSFEDLQYAARQVGFNAEGGSIGFAGLRKLQAPVIVHLNKGTFQHFSVLRGFEGGAALLADSITGNTRLPPEVFFRQYTGVALAVWQEGKTPPIEHQLSIREQDKRHESEYFRSILYQRYDPLSSRL
jgi:predicted double-glycine peptidase